MMPTFSIMHGLGNRFAIFDEIRDAEQHESIDYGVLSSQMCDADLNMRLDGVIVLDVDPDAKASVRMRIWNADGSDGVMCGNGLRCAGKLLRERGHVETDEFDVRTGPGVVRVRTQWDGRTVGNVSVQMGVPGFELAHIPAHAEHLSIVRTAGLASIVEIGGIRGVLVNIGNPHLVIRAQLGSHDADLATFGPQLEHHVAFPERINVQLMQMLARDRIALASWERGAGLTQACATGACASVVAGVLLGELDREVGVHMPGGELRVSWHESSSVVEQSGPAVMEQENLPMSREDLATKTV